MCWNDVFIQIKFHLSVTLEKYLKLITFVCFQSTNEQFTVTDLTAANTLWFSHDSPRCHRLITADFSYVTTESEQLPDRLARSEKQM